MSPVLISLQVGLLSTALGAPLAIGLGWLLARGRFAGKPALSALLMVPMVLPPVVVGIGLLSVLGRTTPIGSAFVAVGWPLSFSFTGAVLAALVVGFPLYVGAARQAFEAVDPAYEELAATLGDPPSTAFRRVVLPLALPGLAAGAVLAFGRALGEFGATMLVCGRSASTNTIALAVYSELDRPDGRVVGLVLASVILSTLVVFAWEWLSGRFRARLAA